MSSSKKTDKKEKVKKGDKDKDQEEPPAKTNEFKIFYEN